MNIIARYGRALLLAAVMAAGSLWLSGCGGDSGTNSGGGSGDDGGTTPGGGGTNSIPGTTPGGGDGSNVTGGTNCTSATTCKSRLMPDGKVWMTENLNIKTDSSWCYGNSPDSCAKYGRLYRWDAAMLACPSGWHLPSRVEWDNLVTAAGVDGNKLKSTSGWNENGNGTNEYGFSALPGGGRFSGGIFLNVGNFCYWWTATQIDGSSAYYRNMDYYYGLVYEQYDGKNQAFSVRCVAN